MSPRNQTGPDGEQIDPVGGVQDREVAVQEDSSDGARTGGDQDGSPITPLTRKKKEKRADNWAASNALVVTEQGEKSEEEIPPPPVGNALKPRLRRVVVVRLEKRGESIFPIKSSLNMTVIHHFPMHPMNAPN